MAVKDKMSAIRENGPLKKWCCFSITLQLVVYAVLIVLFGIYAFKNPDLVEGETWSANTPCYAECCCHHVKKRTNPKAFNVTALFIRWFCVCFIISILNFIFAALNQLGVITKKKVLETIGSHMLGLLSIANLAMIIVGSYYRF